jgi:hypothetical protein
MIVSSRALHTLSISLVCIEVSDIVMNYIGKSAQSQIANLEIVWSHVVDVNVSNIANILIILHLIFVQYLHESL